MEETKRIAMVVVYTAEVPEDLEVSEIYDALEFGYEELNVSVNSDLVEFEKQGELIGQKYNVNVDDLFKIGKA